MSAGEIANMVKMLSYTRPFTYNYHNMVETGVCGLYSFWLRGCCLYVGRSMDIRRRLWEHRTNETNLDLARYMSAFSGDIEVSHIELENITERVLEDIEARVIRYMDPRTNRQNR